MAPKPEKGEKRVFATEESHDHAKKNKAAAVPVQALPATDGTVTAPAASQGPLLPPKWDLAEGALAIQNMCMVCPYVNNVLRNILKTREEFKQDFADIPTYQHQPLMIKDAESMNVNELSSYKAPCTKDEAKKALRSAGLFEGAVIVLWCLPHPPLAGDGSVIADEPILMTEVVVTAGENFTLERPQTVRYEGKQTVARLTFPVTIYVHVDTVDGVDADAFESTRYSLDCQSWLACQNQAQSIQPTALAYSSCVFSMPASWSIVHICELLYVFIVFVRDVRCLVLFVEHSPRFIGWHGLGGLGAWWAATQSSP